MFSVELLMKPKYIYNFLRMKWVNLIIMAEVIKFVLKIRTLHKPPMLQWKRWLKTCNNIVITSLIS